METVFKAEIVNDRILVNAKFTEDGEVVHEVNTAFPVGTSEDDIRDEIEKSKCLFIKERENAAIEAENVSVNEEAESVVNNLNS